MTKIQIAYCAGWQACMAGYDGRYVNPHDRNSDVAYAWNAGFLDAMEAEDDDAPDPECAGF